MPSRSLRALRCGTWLALGLCSTHEAWAADDAEPIRVELHAEPACASGAEFLRAVVLRTRRVRSALGAESARTFHVSIVTSSDGKLSGDFSITEPGSDNRASGKRSIVGESCREVFDALTLFAALSVDPEALTTIAEPSSAGPPEPAKPPPPSAKAATPPSVETAQPATARVSPFQAGVGCDVGLTNASSGSSLVLVEPFAEARFAHTEARLSLAPTVRLGFSSVSTLTTPSTPDGPAHLRWTTLRLDGCPGELELVGSLVARPCLAVSGGALSARGETIAHPESHTLGWWTLGALFRLEWSASRWLSFEASAALDVPVRRDTFYFEPDVPAYTAPAALGRGEVGIGLHFL